MIVADFHLATPILREALAALPDAVVRLHRVYATNSGPIRLQFRVETVDPKGFDAALADDPTVTDPTVLSDSGDARFYRVELTDEGREATTYYQWVQLDAVLLSGVGTDDGWEMRMRFPDRDALARYQSCCEDRDVDFTLRGLYSMTDVEREGFGLTDPQRDILLRAIEMGYFDIPRSASLAEVGDELGISGQAASERLRRALKAYLTNSLYPEHLHETANRPARQPVE